jgi:hypothetical protein
MTYQYIITGFPRTKFRTAGKAVRNRDVNVPQTNNTFITSELEKRLILVLLQNIRNFILLIKKTNINWRPVGPSDTRGDNGKWSTFILRFSQPVTTQSALQHCLTFTHSHTDGGVDHKRRRSGRRVRLGGNVLLRKTSTLS